MPSIGLAVWVNGPECNTLTNKDEKDAVNAKKSPSKASKKAPAKAPKKTVKKAAPKKDVVKKAVAKKTPVKKAVSKNAVVKKTVAKKTAAKKTVAKKVAVKRRAVPKREAPNEDVVKQVVTKKTAPKKTAAKKGAPKKATSKKAVVRKAAVKRRAVPKRAVSTEETVQNEDANNITKAAVKKTASVKTTKKAHKQDETASATSKDDAKDTAIEEPKVSFKDLGLMPEILKALDDVGYTHPTPIQAGSIKAALTRQDVLGIAQTGTGKTGAFTLPIIQSLAKGRARARMPRCLIVCPTRELAAQVAENVEIYSKYLKISMALLIGGVSFAKQEALLNRGVDVLIATPGRLLDHFGRGKVMLNGVEALVVDEADRMLDMGFIPDIEEIFKLTPFTRQVLFFSATMAPEIQRLVDQFLHQPHVVKIARKNITAKTVKQLIVRMPGNDSKQKRTTLRYVIDNNEVKSGIVFCNRKKDVDIVAKSLTVHGHNAAPIHGDLRQSQRMETLAGFKNGDIKFLVASDVAARGLDIPDVSHVFNYDVPSHSEDYVHRIGRTGRAGRKGTAIMFVTPSDKYYYQDILKLINSKEIEEYDVPGIKDFATTSSRRGKSSGGRGKQGGRRPHNNSRGRGGNHSGGRSKGRNNTRAQENKSADQVENKQVDNKQAENKQAGNKPSTKPAANPQNKPENKSAKPAHKPQPKQRQNHPQGKNKPQQRRGRKGDLPKNTKSGFGDSMPAFFGGDD